MPNRKFTTKKGDTAEPFEVQIYGGTVALTGWTARVSVWKKGSTVNKVNNKLMDAIQKEDGKWWFQYYFDAAEINEAGKNFLAEVDTVRPDGKKLTFPRDSDGSPPNAFYEIVVLETRD